jgi:hypothetical protein
MRKISKKLLVTIVTGLLCVSLFGTPAFAALGKISGTVTDATSGEPLPGVNVQVAGTQMGAVTNIQGQYFILNVAPGSYTIKFSFMGYTGQDVQGVVVNLDRTTELSIKLKQTVISGETMTVVAVRPAIDKTMTATKVTFDGEVVNNTLPVANLNEVLQSSVTTQAMRGANKVGVGYLVDGVNVTDPMFAVGMASTAYTNVRHTDNTGANTTGEFESSESQAGRTSTMVQTSVNMAQSSVQEVNVIAGTLNAEYSASGGIINLASRSGGSKYSGKLFVRSSMGGLNHAGPDVYDADVPADRMAGRSAATVYNQFKAKLLSSTDAKIQARAAYMDWTPDKYEYGDDPRMNAELFFGGPMTSKGNFFLTGNFLNDHGRFPGEFQRSIGASLKLNYDLTPTNKLTLMGKLDDGGKLFGWKNRQYSYMYSFFLEGQPVNDRLGVMSYLRWNKFFNASTFLETTLSYVNNHRTYGYAPVDGKLQYDNYGDWLILDTKELADKYFVNTASRIFNVNPGNDQNYQIDDFGNQIRIGLPGYLYEDIKSSVMTVQSNFTKQINFNHQLKAGVQYDLTSLNNYQLASSVTGYDKFFPFETVIWDVKPWSAGAYLQDRIEFQGIIVNAGMRIDGYNIDTQLPKNLLDPMALDTLSNGQVILGMKKEVDSKTHVYFSPRLGISHPITDNAAMHYSWGIYTTKPYFGTTLKNYGVFSNPSLPLWYNYDPEPETATAYEIGMNVSFAKDWNFDITAYYRDTRNSGSAGYTLNVNKIAFSSTTYMTTWGYRDSRGIELNLWKRPSAEKYFGVLGISGNLSLSYAYDKGASAATSLVTDKSARSLLYYGTQDDAYDWDLRNIWPSYARGYNDWKGKLTLLFDLPLDIKLSSMTTYKSAWRYNKTMNITNQRYEEKLNGDYFLQADLRLTKYFTIAGTKIGVFAEALNVLDRENILNYDTTNNNTIYESGKDPYGPYYRATDQYGNPYLGIARELYAGFEFQF